MRRGLIRWMRWRGSDTIWPGRTRGAAMITLHAFSSMFPGGIGETKDMRVQWALEEMGLAYRVHGWDYAAGECDTPAFRAISPFGQIPVIEDDALGEGAPGLAETAAILVHLAETHGRLTPADCAGRAEVRQWCIAAMARRRYRTGRCAAGGPRHGVPGRLPGHPRLCRACPGSAGLAAYPRNDCRAHGRGVGRDRLTTWTWAAATSAGTRTDWRWAPSARCPGPPAAPAAGP